MDAILMDVMESWPLQLSLKTPDGDAWMALDEHVTVLRAGHPVDPGTLRSGARLRILSRSARGTITALEILD